MRFWMVSFQRSRVEEHLLRDTSLHVAPAYQRGIIRRENRYLGYRSPHILAPRWKNSIQNIL